MRLAGSSRSAAKDAREGRWVLLDYVDIVVHIQHAEERDLLRPRAAVAGLPDDPVRAAWRAGRRERELTMSRRVLLLRHGRTRWNAEHRFQGQADPPLDDVGRAQAYEVAGLVAALRPGVLVSSDAARALQTAAPIGEVTGLPVQTDPRLRERSLGHWEGLTRDEVAERFPDEYADWIAGRDVEPSGRGDPRRSRRTGLRRPRRPPRR